MVLIRAHSGFWSKPWSVTTVIRLHVGRPWTSIKQITQKCWMGFFCPDRLYYIDEMRPSWRPWLPSWRAVRDFCLYPGLRAESTGSGTGASWGPRHHLHHYTSCVWFRNPQLRWPLSQTLSSRMQIRRLSAVQFIRRDPACDSHVIDLTFTWVPVCLYWEKHSKQRGCWVLDAAMGFSRTVSSKDV